MAVWSIVKYSEAWEEQRFDPSFWKPIYLKYKVDGVRWVPIGDILKKCQYGISRKMNEDGVGLPMYRMNEMDNLFLSTPEKFAEISDKEKREYKLKNGDVLFNRTNSYKFVGRTGILKHETEAVFASYLIRLKPDESEILPEYLTVYLNTPSGILLAKRRAMESINQTNISGSQIKSVPILKAGMDFQLLIKRLVDEAAVLRLSAKSLLAEAEGMLLAELGLGKLELPKAKWNVRNFSETQREERIDGEYYLPKYYALLKELEKRNPHTLGEIADYKKGIEVGAAAYEEEGVPFWRVSDLSKEEIGGTNTANISDELYESLKKKYEANQGEILFSKDATPGLAYFVREPLKGILCGGILRLQLKEDVNPDYLTLLLNSEAVHLQIVREGGGSIINHLRPERAMSLVIPIIDRDKQNEIGEKVRDSHSARAEAKRLLEEAKRKVEEMILEGE